MGIPTVKHLRLSTLALALAASGLACPPGASAADWVWNTSSGDWNVAENWNPVGLPGNGDHVLIGRADAFVDYVSAADPLLASLTIDSQWTTSYAALHYTYSSQSLTTSTLTLGDGLYGRILQGGGTLNAGDMVLGNSSGAWGRYEMAGAVLNAGSLTVGRAGSGYVNHPLSYGPETRVTVSGGLTLGAEPGGFGRYEIWGGSFRLTVGGQFTVGAAGDGFFMQQGGIVDNSTNALYLGEQATGSGIYEIYDGELKTAGIGVGEWGGTGWFSQYGGVVNVTNELGVARQLDSNGRYELWGGQLTEGWGKVGIDGTGLFLHYGGRHTVTNDLNVGSGAGNGQYIMDLIPDGGGGGNPELNAAVLRIGELGTGSFLQGVGTVNVTGILVIAENFGVQGSYWMQGGTLNTPALFVGDSGQGSFVQTGGVNNAGDLVLGVYGPNSGEPLSGGQYRLEGGELNSTATRIGNEGRGHFVQTGGSHTVVNEVILAHLPGSEGVYELQGGTLTASLVAINAGSAGSAGKLLYSGGTLNANVRNDGYTELSGEGTRTVTGDVYNAGTWKVSGTQAVYTGSFTNAGAYVSDPSVNSFADLVITDTGYLVGGPGDQFLIGGRFESESTQNTLWDTQNAQLIFVGDTDHDFWITGADLGADLAGYDHNFGWGDLQLDGEVLYLIDGNGTPGGALYVGTLSGLVIVDGDTIQNIHGNGLNVYYAPWANPDLGGKTYALMDGGSLAPVPEPRAWALMLAGLGLLAGVVRRRLRPGH